MGIVDFLKGIFSEPKVEEKPLEQEIQVSELEAWFASREADIMRGTGVVMENAKPRFMDILKLCEQSCSSLRNAQPRYPQLYEQNKVVAEGNRASFVTAAENLLKTFKFPDSPNDFSVFIQNSNSALGEFMSSSNRSFIISNEFFTEQTANIKKCMQELDKVLQELATHHREKKLAELPQVKEKIEKLVLKISQSKQLEAELKEAENRLKDIQAQIEKAKQNLSEFSQSKAFLERQELESELKDMHAKIKAHKDELHNIFAILDIPLKKMTWDNSIHKKLMDSYFSDLITAISQDESFKFGDVIAKLKEAIETKQIYAKDKRRSQTLESINKLTREFLQEWLASYRNLKDKEAGLQSQIENSQASVRESELKAEIQKLEHKQETLNESRAAIIRGQKHIDLDEEIKEAGSSISSMFGMQIKILKD